MPPLKPRSNPFSDVQKTRKPKEDERIFFDKDQVRLDNGLRFQKKRAELQIGGSDPTTPLGPAGRLGIMDQGSGVVFYLNASGKTADAMFGNEGKPGRLAFKNNDGVEVVVIDARKQGLFLGNTDFPGNLSLYNEKKSSSVKLDGKKGGITLFNESEQPTVKLLGSEGEITLFNKSGQPTVKLLGGEGDIQLLGADCAEEFSVLPDEEIEPGSVLVMQNESYLTACDKAYDTRVAGVVSGAGDFKPGLILDKKASKDLRVPVALMGKVFCLVDAKHTPIKVGDLLTTSPVPGYAMKASNPSRAFGAVIGKALREHSKGQGLIPILVGLQ